MKLEIDDSKLGELATQAALERIERVITDQANAMFSPAGYRVPAGEGHTAVIALVREAVSRVLAGEDVRAMVDARVTEALEEAVRVTADRVAKARITKQLKITEGGES